MQTTLEIQGATRVFPDIMRAAQNAIQDHVDARLVLAWMEGEAEAWFVHDTPGPDSKEGLGMQSLREWYEQVHGEGVQVVFEVYNYTLTRWFNYPRCACGCSQGVKAIGTYVKGHGPDH